MKNLKNKFVLMLSVLILLTTAVPAQTTAFTYQGKLNDGGNPANTTFQMEFKLFDALSGGNQIGSTVANSSVSVAQGVFAVSLDFGANAFTDADRFLEISVKRNAGDPFTVLTPRQRILSVPFAIKSKSSDTAITATTANQLDGLPSSRFVQLDANGDVSIGTTSTGSKLTVAGVIESTSGGIKFPDATVQTTAGLTAINTNPTLTGDGTSAAPLGINSPLQVRDMDNPARQPFQACTSSPGTTNLVTVADGKILVVEYVSAWIVATAANQSDGIIGLQAFGGTSFQHSVTPQSVRVVGTSTYLYYSQPMKMYIFAGQLLRVNFLLGDNRNFCITGFFVDVAPSSMSNKSIQK